MKTRTWILLLGSIFAIFCLLSVLLLLPHGRAAQVELWSEGRYIQTLRLDQNTTFVIENTNGSNTLVVQDGKISVTQATCPDHYCMKRGARDHAPDIICLPNQLVIKFITDTALDAAAG